MSVVEKVAQVALNPAHEASHARLRAAEAVLADGGASADAKTRARTVQFTELAELEHWPEISKLGAATQPQDPAALTVWAYALYRLGRVAELREIVPPGAPVGAQLALAQAEYKAGHLAAATQLLETARAAVDSQDLGDISVNLSAIAALSGEELPQAGDSHASGGAGSDSGDASTFDGVFNTARRWLTRGRPERALPLLQKAVLAAADEDDRQSATVQAAYVHARLGDAAAARELLEGLLPGSADADAALSPSLALVARNNLAALQYDGTLVGAHAALVAYDTLAASRTALNADQWRVLERNTLKLRARAGVPKATRHAEQHQQQTGDFEPAVVALQYTHTPKQIRKLALQGNTAAKLWVAQAAQDAAKSATGSSTGSSTGSTAAGSTASSVSQRKNAEFVRALAARNRDPNALYPQGDIGVLVPAVDEALRGDAGLRTELSTYFESLGPELAAAGAALLDPAQPIDEAGLDELLDGLDAAELDAAGIPAAALAAAASANAGSSAAKKRKRAGRKLPASYDAAKQPDPERWLAKADRSDFRAKKAKKGSQATQGGAGNAEVHVASAPSQVVSGKPSKSKKKKGKK